MSKFGTLKEIFELFIHKRKFHMFPIIVLLIADILASFIHQSMAILGNESSNFLRVNRSSSTAAIT